jgi:nitrogen fixation/metabolism regulation signal transduction histidine kinase
MRNKQKKLLFRDIIAYLGRMSIRRKVTFAILVSFIMTLPSVGLSLMYFSRILQQINLIIEQDVTLGRHATDLSLLMLDIRRNERNYRLIGGISEHDSALALFDRGRKILENAEIIAPETEKLIVQAMDAHLTIYTNSFTSLSEYLTSYPPGDRIQRFRSQFIQEMGDFQNRYKAMMAQIETASPAQRDSLVTAMTEAMESLSLDQLSGYMAQSDSTAQPAYIQDNLNRSSQAFLSAAQNLAERSWNNMHAHQAESHFIEARAKRNIITVLIFTGLFCIYMITSMPQKIIRPITRLNVLLRKTGEGDFTARAKVITNDEMGDLTRSYNQVLDRITMYEELKSKKIASQKRILERLLEYIQMPACVLDARLTILYYNVPFAGLFGGAIPNRPPDTGLEISRNDAFKEFFEDLQHILSQSSNEFIVQLNTRSGERRRFRGRLVRNTLMQLESIVLIEAPRMPPEENG